mgnify:CR=1 FL=1
MKPGRPPKRNIEPILKEILSKQGHITPTEIIRRYEKIKGEKHHWTTIKKNLDKMIKEGLIQEIISNQTEKRVTSIYALK